MARSHVVRIQDSVHGLMEFRGMEGVVVEVLRSAELQRLRRIRHLGLAHLVFPGAEHSRLVHSLGAAYLAARFGRQVQQRASEHFSAVLCPDEAVVRDLAVAALCHDLGHGPLSHAWEREIVGQDFSRKDWATSLGIDLPPPTLGRLKWHELVGQALLAWPDGQLHRLLEKHETGSSDRIRHLLVGEYYFQYVPRLLASDVDVDRCDFIRRDTHQTGVAYGRYDLNWLISVCTLGSRSVGLSRQFIIGFDERKAIRVVEQFLIARRAMYDTVYYHKTVHCAEGMMGLFLRRLRQILKDGSSLPVSDFVKPAVKAIRGGALSPPEVLSLDDYAIAVLIEMVAQSDVKQLKDDTVRDLARRIKSRDLFKQVKVESDKLNRFLRKPDARQMLRDAIKPFCPGDPDYYLIVDETHFRMMSEDDATKVFFVRDDGEAVAATEHQSFDAYRTVKSDGLRLFTLAQAVSAATACVHGN